MRSRGGSEFPPGLFPGTTSTLGRSSSTHHRSVAISSSLATSVGYSYQLAVVTDDAAMGISQVIRGMDLVPSTPRQILLYRASACRFRPLATSRWRSAPTAAGSPSVMARSSSRPYAKPVSILAVSLAR